MSLVRLLSAGRSLVGMRESVGRYQLTEQRLVPDFGANARNGKRKTGSEPAQAEQQMKSKQPGLAREGVWSRWLSRLCFWRKSGAAPIAASSAVRVQQELSLDAVKVVRNDLSDSDLELVAASRRAADTPKAAPQPAKPALSLRATAGQLLGLSKS